MSPLWTTLAAPIACSPDGKEVPLETAASLDDERSDGDGDGFSSTEDCNDGDASVNPGAVELCDGIDNDCDGSIDEEVLSTFYADTDGDGYGDAAAASSACAQPAGTVPNSNDCDDTDAAVYPGAPEVCDGVDNDCSGDTDEAVGGSWYADADGDGYGDPDTETEGCDPGVGWVRDNSDCNDTEADAFPGNPEVCDEVDNDCDGAVDEDQQSTYYLDLDGDGWGDPATTTLACTTPAGYADAVGDCDDGDDAVHPDATEACDGIDNDCDGTIDGPGAVGASTWYADTDGDGYGDAASATVDCEAPTGFLADGSDCDDGDDAVHPGATEACDGIDNDCDGSIDGPGSVGASTWYADTDGDGYGDALSSTTACTEPSGFVSDSTDCDDGAAGVNPGEDEICSGIDEDCDGAVDDLGPTELFAGSLTAGESKHYQYSPVTTGAGYLYANWVDDPRADSFEVAVGTSPGASDVETWTDVGAVSSTTLSGLTLDGAWDGAEYYLSIRPVNGTTACATSATADVLQIAEAAVWTGDVADLRTPDSLGGYTTDWPQTGVDAIFGEHWFEEVDIAAGTTVYVQGWGAEDAVSTGVSSTDVSVTDPLDGWVALYANDISISGAVTATGRGYGGGGGGGAGIAGGYQGSGGSLGLGGAGGPASSGAGGGGSPGGAGGVGVTTGGAGNLYGGGGGSTDCSGSNGRAGGDGSVGTVGGTGGTASSGSPGAGGVGEFTAGGGRGVSGCDNWSGGGGGAYGGGGGGGSQWAGPTAEASGGGAGGSGGSGGGRTVNGATAAGPFGGSGGTNGGSYTGSAGSAGGYLASGSNGDTSTDRSWALGSGGGGGSGGYQETGGGGGGAGGGAILLYAVQSLTLDSTAYLLANGAGGGGGARDNGGSSTSGAGGTGAGGTLVLEAQDLELRISPPYISATGGGGSTTNGGTIKLFYDTFTGTTPSSSGAGRVYDAGAGSWVAP